MQLTEQTEVKLLLPTTKTFEEWYYSENLNKKTKVDDEYIGKFMLFYSAKNEFEFNFKEFLPWKCYCTQQNSSNYEICECCFQDRPQKEDKIYKTCSLNLQWLRTIQHTENGNLGICSKVSTNLPWEDMKTGVIIIYTKDYRDEEDVLRVGRNICKYLGWKRKINYKTDEATLIGKYASQNEKSSLYTYDPKTDTLSFSKK